MILRKTPSFLLAAAAFALLCPIAEDTAAQQPPADAPQTRIYVCTAIDRAGGHEEPSLISPPMRMEDGRLRILEQDETAYASWTGDNTPGWLALYAGQDGSSGSFLGHFPSDSFKCKVVTD